VVFPTCRGPVKIWMRPGAVSASRSIRTWRQWS